MNENVRCHTLTVPASTGEKGPPVSEFVSSVVTSGHDGREPREQPAFGTISQSYKSARLEAEIVDTGRLTTCRSSQAGSRNEDGRRE
jgi:hypothetical protein